jgi:ABC-type spermidine/putrescine transport system permease subunit I
MDPSAAQNVLMYFVLPVWLAAGFADYLCHRAADIEHTSGVKETLLHLAQFAEMAIPTLAAIFLEINALIIAIMIVALIVHHATAIWDVSYAYRTREVTPTEQHVHSVLEMLPLTALLVVITLHWQQFLALFGFGSQPAEFALRLKEPPLPWLYVTVILSIVLLFEVLPYLEELVRGLRAKRRQPYRDAAAVPPRFQPRPPSP